MHALEGYRGDGAGEHTVRDRNDINVLGAHNDVHLLVAPEALVDTDEGVTGKGDLQILVHNAVDDITLADKVGNKGVLRLVVDVGRRADLLDFALGHNNDRV